MKLYYMPGACSLAPHVALREAEIPFTLVRYDRSEKQVEGGGSLEAVNEKGYLPVLELEDGQRLTEVSAVLQYIADLKPESGLAPRQGTFERYRLIEWLNFLATEVHKGFWPLFHEGCEAERPTQGDRLQKRLAWLDEKLTGRPFLMGSQFTVADTYLFTMANWIKPAGLDPSRWPRLKEYRDRLRVRPSVVAALTAEGLIKRAANA